MNIFVARQPIFTKRKTTFGYELLFRQGFENTFPGINGDAATSRVLLNTFLTTGIDTITGRKPGFINFTRNLLLNGVPLLFPRKKLFIEILESVTPEDPVLDALKQLKSKGYVIALDDFCFKQEKARLVSLADIIKFDIMATPLNTIALQVEYLRRKKTARLLAEKVETYQEFEQAKRLGFSLFQGFFFSKPEVIKNKGIPLVKKNILDLIREIEKPDIDFTNIAGIIRNDMSISYKLLRLINSAYFKRPCEINTIHDAVIYLGQEELKKFIRLIAVAEFTAGKPDELMRTAISRARMCELSASCLNTGFPADTLFTIGLFSMLDAMLDLSMETLLESLGFSQRLADALLGNNKAINIILNIIRCFEHGEWGSNPYFQSLPLAVRDAFASHYIDAVNMADSFTA